MRRICPAKAFLARVASRAHCACIVQYQQAVSTDNSDDLAIHGAFLSFPVWRFKVALADAMSPLVPLGHLFWKSHYKKRRLIETSTVAVLGLGQVITSGTETLTPTGAARPWSCQRAVFVLVLMPEEVWSSPVIESALRLHLVWHYEADQEYPGGKKLQEIPLLQTSHPVAAPQQVSVSSSEQAFLSSMFVKAGAAFYRPHLNTPELKD